MSEVYIKIREGKSAWQHVRDVFNGDIVVGTLIEDYRPDDLLIGIEVVGALEVTIDGVSVDSTEKTK